MTEIRYNIAVETEDTSILIPWGEAKGWADKYRDQLNSADSIALIPKEGESLPVVTVDLSEGRRWILFSRVYGVLNKSSGGKNEIRMYCIGWQKKIKGTNVKSLNWVYPGGSVENGENPTYVDEMLKVS